jgi:hypothetical protein
MDEFVLKDLKALEAKFSTQLDDELKMKEAHLRRELTKKLTAKNRLKELHKQKTSASPERDQSAPVVAERTPSIDDDFEEQKALESKIASIRRSHEVCLMNVLEQYCLLII